MPDLRAASNDYVNYLAQAEIETAAALAPAITDYIDVGQRLTRLGGSILVSHADYSKGSSTSGLVVATILSHLLNHLQECTRSARSGYVVQALTIASAMIEAAHTAPFIGADDARARRWLDHDDPAHSFPGLKQAIDATASAGGSPDQYKVREYDVFYRDLSMAKHSNPIALKKLCTEARNDLTTVHLGPHSSPNVIRAARSALAYAARFTWFGAMAFTANHIVGDQRIGLLARLNELGTDLNHLGDRDAATYAKNAPHHKTDTMASEP